MLDGLEVLADDEELRIGEEVVDVGDSAAEGVLDRDHGQGDVTVRHRLEDLLEGLVRDGLHLGMGLLAREV